MKRPKLVLAAPRPQRIAPERAVVPDYPVSREPSTLHNASAPPDARRTSKAAPSTVRSVARALTVMGLLGLSFGLFQARIGDLSERRAQRVARAALTQVLNLGSGLGQDGKGHVSPIAVGTGIALLDIPRIDVHKVVVDGADANTLKKGPGLTSSSVLPGQPGQAIVVGRRTTFGSPFRHLEVLAAGDEIQATTPYGKFKFKVRENRVVGGGSATNLSPATGGLLTLVTSDPPYIGGSALMVVATLEGDPSAFPDPPRAGAGKSNSVPVNGNGGAATGVVVFGGLLLTVLVGTDKLYRRWSRWSAYLLTTPLILALVYAWMESLTSLLPSSL